MDKILNVRCAFLSTLNAICKHLIMISALKINFSYKPCDLGFGLSAYSCILNLSILDYFSWLAVCILIKSNILVEIGTNYCQLDLN